jgi:hypothetical protein
MLILRRPSKERLPTILAGSNTEFVVTDKAELARSTSPVSGGSVTGPRGQTGDWFCPTPAMGPDARRYASGKKNGRHHPGIRELTRQKDIMWR